jgi:hypothetical protein
MSNEVAERTPLSLDLQEKVLLGGDLSKLSPAERLSYYGNLCASLDLNPLTRPFEYLILSGKTVLYARKDCTEQLRTKKHISIDPKNFTKEVIEGIFVVTAWASTPEGRTDVSTGAVPIEGLKGLDRANAMMKAETKAKRRVTLSICGLGMLDETEIETIKDARVVPQVRLRNDATMVRPAVDKYTGEPIRQEDGAGAVHEAATPQQASDAPAPTAAEYCRQQAEQAPESVVHVERLTFGKHKGKAINDQSVPNDYLSWLEGQLKEQITDPKYGRYREEKQRLLDAVRGELIDRNAMPLGG